MLWAPTKIILPHGKIILVRAYNIYTNKEIRKFVNVHMQSELLLYCFSYFKVFDRGMLRSLWVGVLIAVPSGAGVAIGILGGNAGSLVGVAISASLLPPAVNAVSKRL